MYIYIYKHVYSRNTRSKIEELGGERGNMAIVYTDFYSRKYRVCTRSSDYFPNVFCNFYPFLACVDASARTGICSRFVIRKTVITGIPPFLDER